jgi:hypothetical protein
MRAYTAVPQENRGVVATESPAFQAYGILLFGFTVAPIIAGADKFFGILTNWTQYLAPIFPNTLGIDPATFMMIIGAIEIIAGIIVVLEPTASAATSSRCGLLELSVNLLLLHNFHDIALAGFGAVARRARAWRGQEPTSAGKEVKPATTLETQGLIDDGHRAGGRNQRADVDVVELDERDAVDRHDGIGDLHLFFEDAGRKCRRLAVVDENEREPVVERSLQSRSTPEQERLRRAKVAEPSQW